MTITWAGGDATHHAIRRPVAEYSQLGQFTQLRDCINSGRQFIGFETDPTYHAIAVERVARAQAQVQSEDRLAALFL